MHLYLVDETSELFYNLVTTKSDGVIAVQPEIDFVRVGQRIKIARQEKGLNQAELGRLVGCSNNHMSHVEIGQTKVSLSMLLKISSALEKDLNYFLMDTPFVQRDCIIDTEISHKLDQCTPATLVAISKMIDILLEQQQALSAEQL